MPEFQFDSISDFLAMGGYAIYVWPTYILFALFFVITIVPPMRGRKRLLRQLKARMARLDNESVDTVTENEDQP